MECIGGVKTMSHMYVCFVHSITGPLDRWNVAIVSNTENMFADATNGWNASQVIQICHKHTYTFDDATLLNQVLHAFCFVGTVYDQRLAVVSSTVSGLQYLESQ